MSIWVFICFCYLQTVGDLIANFAYTYHIWLLQYETIIFVLLFPFDVLSIFGVSFCSWKYNNQEHNQQEWRQIIAYSSDL